MPSLEGTIQLDEIIRIKALFDEVEEQCPEGIELEDFITQFGPLIGPNLTRLELSHLFMKIDADSNGSIDWDEFSNYMFLDNKTEQMNNEIWTLLQKDFPIEEEAANCHKGMCTSIGYIPFQDKYTTCSSDGVVKVWEAEDLRPCKSFQNTHAWITDSCYMPHNVKLAMCAMDRSISFYDVRRNSFLLAGRVFINGAWGTPMCMARLSGGRLGHDAEGLLYGDDVGGVHFMRDPCHGLSTSVKRELSSNEVTTLHTEHTDWVSKVMYIQDINSVVSSSLDEMVLLYDPETGKQKLRMGLHSQGVYSFDFTQAYSMCASCGIERDILLWHAITGRKMGTLQGHNASVTSVVMNEKLNQLISVSQDKMIKLWDLRINKCMLTLTDSVTHRPENRISSVMYDGHRSRFLTAATRPYVWPHVSVTVNSMGHSAPVGSALFNSEFDYVVSADEEGMVFVWNVNDGTFIGKFSNETGTKITAICFDSGLRRLLLADNEGAVKMFNYNNGALLKEFTHTLDMNEVTGLMYVADQQRAAKLVVCVGWNKCVVVWEELEDEHEISEFRVFEGHTDDILCCACCDPGMLATGDYSGKIVVWNLSTGLRRKELFHTSQFEYERSVEKVLFLPKRLDKGNNPMLVSCGGDGVMRLWSLSGYNGTLQQTFRGAHGTMESVSCVGTDDGNTVLFAGDTAGHVRAWNIEQIDKVPEASSHSAVTTVSHFKLSDAGIASVEYADKHGLLIVASLDCIVVLCTLEGCLIGRFGTSELWQISDKSTWKDATGAKLKRPKPLDEDEMEKLAKQAAFHERAASCMGQSSSSRGLGSHRVVLETKQSTSMRSSLQPSPPPLALHTRVNQILQEGKAVRARGGKSGFNVDEFVTKQRSRLHCHDMKELPETVAELRTTLVGPRGAHMTRNEKSSKQLGSNKKRAQSVQDVGSRKDVSGSLSARGRLVGITNSNLTLPPIQNRGMLTSRT